MFHTFTGLVLLTGMLLMAGCGALLDSIEDDPKFTPIKKQFIKDAKFFGINANVDNVKIAFGDTDKEFKYAGFITISKGNRSNPDGFCQILKSKKAISKPLMKMALGSKYNTKSIIISDRYKDASLDFLETLVYHELGHCVLGYDHRENSVMGHDVAFMGALRYFWLQEFFTRASIAENLLVKKVDITGNDWIPLYQVDYTAFGQRLSQELYVNPDTHVYYSIDNFQEGPYEW